MCHTFPIHMYNIIWTFPVPFPLLLSMVKPLPTTHCKLVFRRPNSLHEDPRIRPNLIPAAHPRTFLRHQHEFVRGPMRCNLCTVNNCFTRKKRLPAKKWPQSPVLSKIFTLFTSRLDRVSLQHSVLLELVGMKVYGVPELGAWPTPKSYKNSNWQKRNKNQIMAVQKLPS